jgi:hypothetical protein
MKAENTLRELVAFTLESFLCAPRHELRAPPSLLHEEGQVVDPITFTNSAWIDNVAQVVFGVRDDKIGVHNCNSSRYPGLSSGPRELRQTSGLHREQRELG